MKVPLSSTNQPAISKKNVLVNYFCHGHSFITQLRCKINYTGNRSPKTKSYIGTRPTGTTLNIRPK
jgi:hypothetical protein